MSPADQFFALADATRCRVVEMLSERAMPVHELAAAFSISRPAISRHLRVLKEAGLVKEIKRGRENIYTLQRQKLAPIGRWLERQGRAVTPARKPARKVAVEVVRTAAKSLKNQTVQPPRAAAPQAQLDLF